MSPFSLDVLDVLAAESGEATWTDLPELWAAYSEERRAGRTPFASAVRVATRADRLGHAFAVGYPAALERLVPGIALPCALCATEAQGNAPRAIETTLVATDPGYRLDGTKTFVTFGSLANTLIIVARVGEKPDGRPDIAVVQLPATRAGIVLTELPPTPFVPEVRHAQVRLEGVDVAPAERLPGDGYLGYVKPFRTIEDIHVVGATLGYVLGLARRFGADPLFVSELTEDLVALAALCGAEPLDPRAHVALHGCYQRVTSALRSESFTRVLDAAGEEERGRWHRDERLLSIASKAREARFAAATKALSSSPRALD